MAGALKAVPRERFDAVLANPPFGKKSSTMIVGEYGKISTEKDIIGRDDFRATTLNRQLNVVQHNTNRCCRLGRPKAPKKGASRRPRRRVNTLLRTNRRAAVVVPENVLNFDKKPAFKAPWTQQHWIYDLRTNKHFALKTNSKRPVWAAWIS